MQDIDTWRDTLTNIGDQLTVVDIRDGKEYWVGKQADGKIWMTQNLDFEITAEPLTSETSDLTAYNTGGYTSAAGYAKDGDIIKWTPAATAITSERTVPISTTTGNISGLTNWTNDNHAPYSAEGGDVYVYTSNSTSDDAIYTSLADCVAASHTEAECKHYHRGNYYNWSAAVASNNTNVTELTTQYNTAANSICPAGWKLPVSRNSSTQNATTMQFGNLMYTSGINTSVNGTSYATNGFNNIRSNPLFFMRSGYVGGTSLYNSGIRGGYWSSSIDSSTIAYGLYFSSSSVNPASYNGRYNGFSVRCVARDPIYYMQDVDKWENKIPNTGDSMIAVDKRDGKEYWVGRQADDNIWMTQNLDFEITGEALTSETTDLTAYGESTGYTSSAGYAKYGDTIKWMPTGTAVTSERVVPVSTTTGNGSISGLTGWENDNYIPYSAEGGDVYVYTSNSTDNDTVYTSLSSCVAASHTEAECKHYHRGNYYNWSAAIASNNSNVAKLTSSYNIAQNSICPAGWRLPVGQSSSTPDATTMEIGNLLYTSGITDRINAYAYTTDGFSNIRSNPLYFTRSGVVHTTSLGLSGYSGLYWTSSPNSNYGGTQAHELNFNSGGVHPGNFNYRFYGYSVRCVARDPIYYMQDVAKWESKIPNAGDSIIAVDKRDGKEYWVGRQADGNIWMTQNLDFEITSTPLTSDTSDLTAYNTGGYTSAAGYTQENGIIKWTPAATAITSGRTVPVSTSTEYEVSGVTGWANNNNVPYSAEGGDVYVYTSASTSTDTVYTSLSSCTSASHTEAECKHYHRGNYYNWPAAIANNNTNVTELTTQYNTASNSICPVGWKLPVGQSSSTQNATTMQFGNLLYTSVINTSVSSSTYAADGFKNIRSNPLFFVRSGNVSSTSLYSSGTNGRYWSSSVGSNPNAYILNFISSYVYPASSYNRYYGFSIRCVAR